MIVNKNKFVCVAMFFLYTVWAFFIYGDSSIHDNIVTAYDEIRYLNATDLLIIDFQKYGLFYVLENYYNYSQSVHFLHYFVLAFIRYISNDYMLFWVIFQIGIYTLGAFYFSKYIKEEYSFIEKKQICIISFLILVYPVYYYLVFSLMRDISIFLFLSLSLYFYKKNKIYQLVISLFILSLYRINMTLCILVYFIVNQLKDQNFLVVFKYLTISIISIFIINLISFGYLFNGISRLNSINYLDFVREYLVLFFSPLPFSIDVNLPEYLRVWFFISFFICLLLIALNIFFYISKKFKNITPVMPIYAMSIVYVFIYSTEIGIGFRQSSIILPFIYIPILFFIIHNLNRKLL